jgi:hypothetical protein
MNSKTPYIMLIPLLLVACFPKQEQNIDSNEDNKISFSETIDYTSQFKELLQAHGGLENWRKYGLMQYKLTTKDNSETHIIDLKTRKDLVLAEKYKIGFDGDQVWVSPNRLAYPGKSARFYHNLYFYFYAIPFVLADPGINFEDLGQTEIQGKSYKTLGVTFSEGIGDTPEDEYRLLIDLETNRLEWLLYTVTYFDKKTSNTFNALKYDNYQEHKGLIFPQKLTGYTYANGQIGDVRYSVSIDSLLLEEKQPEQQQFEKPTNAEYENL